MNHLYVLFLNIKVLSVATSIAGIPEVETKKE